MSAIVWGNVASNGKQLTRREVREQIRLNERFIIDTILPNGAFHILTGPSGIGKTTWLCQMLFDWEQGKSVLGFASHPCQWVYVSLDRTLSETDRTLRRLGLEQWEMPCYNMAELIPRSASGQIELEPHINQIMAAHPHAELYVIEGLQGLTPNTARGQSQNKAELIFMLRIQDAILSKGKTILAVTHPPKSGNGGNDREGILGSQALIGAASTIIKFDVPPDVNGNAQQLLGVNQPNERLVTIMGRDFPNIYLNYDRMPNGGFDLSSRIIQPSKSGDALVTDVYETHADKLLLLDMRLGSVNGYVELALRDLKQWGRDIGLGDNSVSTWIKRAFDDGKLLKEGPGKFRRSGTIQ